MSAKLTGKLLKSVSRSFYLSICVLPHKLRQPIGLAYLLARTCDTIADTANASIQTRLRRLGDLEGLVRGLHSPNAIASIQRDIQPEHIGERDLIDSLPQVLQQFSALKAWEWQMTAELLADIIRGQRNDLEVFNDPTSLIALPDTDTLEDYIYLVAGSVGEWWTRLCFRLMKNYSHISEDELSPLANSLGKALQLVNILRDFPADIAAGRCYLPASELEEIGVDPKVLQALPTQAQPVYDAWLAKARLLLDQGRIYIASIRTRRVRIACYIPWRLAGQTLDLIEQRQPLTSGEKVKVTRSAVRAAIWRSIRVAFSNKALG